MKFRTRLIVGFSSILAGIVFFSIIVFSMLSVMNANMNKVVNEDYSNVNQIYIIRYELNNLARDLNFFLLNPESDERQRIIDSVGQRHDKILAAWDQILKSTPSLSQEPIMTQFQALYGNYVESTNQVLKKVEEGAKEEAINFALSTNEQNRKNLSVAIEEYKLKQEEAMADSVSVSLSSYENAVNTLILLVVSTLIVSSGIAIWVYHSVTKNLRRVTSVINNINYAGIENIPRIEVYTRDEVGDIAVAFNRMADKLEDHVEQELSYQRTLEEQSWKKAAIAEVTLLYQGVQDLHMLANAFLSEIVPKIGASHGVFYIMMDHDGERPYLKKSASYAEQVEHSLPEELQLGEGLIGQCAMDNKSIALTSVPSNYIRIGSGLGSAAPASIMILPVSSENTVLAVFEVASFTPFTGSELALLEELADTMSVPINRIRNHMKVQQLLRESQVYSEELQAQSEELQQQQEELRALNERLEEQVKQSERKSKELERSKKEIEEKNKEIMLASKYKSEFLANVSHELRTPLNSMLILSQMLAENKNGNLQPKQLEFIRTIHSSGTDLLNLINEILDLSKIESGKAELSSDITTVGECLTAAMKQFEPVALQRKIQFVLESDPGLLEQKMVIDQQKLDSIIKNLLSNAVKFTEKGNVKLSARKAEPSEIEGHPVLTILDDVLAISVTDTGIGIPKEKFDIIFEAFQQADGTTSRKFGGTGLGLSISKEFAALLGGFIRVESQVDVGSTFTLYIPMDSREWMVRLAEAEAAAASAAEKAERLEFEDNGSSEIETQSSPKVDQEQFDLLNGKKVLLVDDDMRNIYALTTFLETYGIQVHFAENGEEGIELLLEQPDTDLVLMDIMMPRMDGYEAIGKIRSMPEFEKLPIIALTAKAMKNDKEECIRAGASDYISKPVQIDQLLSLLQVWLHR
ncbi:response regulator [Paenibacillus turpanensis]|uniref:response regulator n=1 Tax=Paenibacillus turpanensis TaxID=2689078 RepID=UPI0014089251|nr:response regulator [Paenibacillus turpanensis]